MVYTPGSGCPLSELVYAVSADSFTAASNAAGAGASRAGQDERRAGWQQQQSRLLNKVLFLMMIAPMIHHRKVGKREAGLKAARIAARAASSKGREAQRPLLDENLQQPLQPPNRAIHNTPPTRANQNRRPTPAPTVSSKVGEGPQVNHAIGCHLCGRDCSKQGPQVLEAGPCKRGGWGDQQMLPHPGWHAQAGMHVATFQNGSASTISCCSLAMHTGPA